MEKDIKDYREKELKSYVIGNIILALIGVGFIDSIVTAIGKEDFWNAGGVIVSSGIVSSLTYIYTYIVDALVPGDAKNTIIWWKSGVPGNRVFSQIKQNNKDKRFTAQEVLEKYAAVYKSIEEAEKSEKKSVENSAWYGAYQRNEKSAQVFVSNRDWLLCRDMCVMTLWIIAGCLLMFWLLKKALPCWLVAVLVTELIGTWGAARVKSKRFVYNVIAKDVHNNHKPADRNAKKSLIAVTIETASELDVYRITKKD